MGIIWSRRFRRLVVPFLLIDIIYNVLVVGIRVEEDGKAGDDACDDGDGGFVDGDVVVLDE